MGPIKRKKVVKSKARVWYVPPKQLYQFKYSWLPQPMVKDAAIHIKSPNKKQRAANIEASSASNSQEIPISPSKLPHSPVIPGGNSLAFGSVSQLGMESLDLLDTHMQAQSQSQLSLPEIKSVAATSKRGTWSSGGAPTTKGKFNRFMKSFASVKTREQQDKKQMHSFPFK